jgi:hypothetical protein
MTATTRAITDHSPGPYDDVIIVDPKTRSEWPQSQPKRPLPLPRPTQPPDQRQPPLR